MSKSQQVKEHRLNCLGWWSAMGQIITGLVFKNTCIARQNNDK